MKHKITLISPNTTSHRTTEETLALGYIASILRKSGYVVTIIDGWLQKLDSVQIVNRIIENGIPSIIGISCYYSNLKQAKIILDEVRRRIKNIYSICGGYGPTFHDEAFLNAGFTVAIRGEAEHMITSLVDALIHGNDLSNVSGISFINNKTIIRTENFNFTDNLDTLPLPARDEIHHSLQQSNPVHVCTSRGCFGHCTFCSIFAFSKFGKGKQWRGRSVKNIIDELCYLHDTFGVTNIKFVDDSFLEPPRDEKWIQDFAYQIKKNKLPLRFRTQVRADRLTLPIVQNLKKVGWFATSIGVENGSQTSLDRMNKTATVVDNLRALKLLNDNDIYVQLGMILFDEDTTVNELEENYNFLIDHDWVVTKGIFTEMFAAKGTIFAEKISRNGLLKTETKYQNFCYFIKDSLTRRAYRMLKQWHSSHSYLYGWVIDSISAPKVLDDNGYRSVHILCRELLNYDLVFFKKVIKRVRKDKNEHEDEYFVNNFITQTIRKYEEISTKIEKLYIRYGLIYDSNLNPFLH